MYNLQAIRNFIKIKVIDLIKRLLIYKIYIRKNYNDNNNIRGYLEFRYVI